MGLRDLLGKRPAPKPGQCGGCGRGVPSGARFCPRCARAGGVRRSGQPVTTTTKKAPAVSVCGQRLSNGGTCYRSVARGETCDNPKH